MSTIFARFRRLFTLCCALILPVIFATPDGESSLDQRSLNNYVTTSVPYVVDDHRNKHISVADRVKEILKQNTRNRTRETFDRANSSAVGATTDHASSVQGTFKPYSQGELNKILQKYEYERDGAQESNNVANYYGFNANVDSQISSSSPTDDPDDKSKAWNVISYSQNTINKNPYDDRLGWVTLEPIAWSSSQVQKWEPNTKPNWPLPLSDNGVWGSSHITQQHSTFNTYQAERPYKRPTYQYQSKPWSSFGKPQYSGHFANEEIITDGQPGYFPSDKPSQSAYRPWVEQTQSISYTDSSNHPSTHVVYQGIGVGHNHHLPEREPTSASSAEGDGHWVLLSSSKGYSVPHKHRSGFGPNDGNDSANEETKTSNRQNASVRTGRVIDTSGDSDVKSSSSSSTAASNVIEANFSENETHPTRFAKINTNSESMITKNEEN